MYDSTVETSGSTKRKYNKDQSDSEMGYCGKFLRYLVLVINFFFICIGFVVLVYGAWYTNFSSTASDLTGKGWTGFVVALGIFVMIVGIIGLVGAKWQNRVILVFYFVVIIVLFILTLACGAWVLSLEGKESSLVTTGWTAATPNIRSDAQNAYYCCGLNTYNDSYHADPCPIAPAGADPNGPNHPCLPDLVASVMKYYNSFAALILVICITLLGDVGLTWWLFKVLNRMKARTAA